MNMIFSKHVKYFPFFLFALFCFVPFTVCAQEAQDAPRFFSSLPDVPLMVGMVELEDSVVVYDKPEGRIVESVALLGELSRDEVLAFYRMTLPQLGWGVIKDAQFFRRNEFLDISFEDMQGRRAVRILIRPTR